MKDKTINLKHKALDILSRREHSYKELYTKLAKFSDDHEEITKVMTEMIAKKFLSEERFIESYISSKSKKYGSLKIKYMLNNKVADQALVNEIYNNADIDELSLAVELLQKKYARDMPQDNNDKAKAIRFLIGRGFNYSIANQALREFMTRDENHE